MNNGFVVPGWDEEIKASIMKTPVFKMLKYIMLFNNIKVNLKTVSNSCS